MKHLLWIKNISNNFFYWCYFWYLKISGNFTQPKRSRDFKRNQMKNQAQCSKDTLPSRQKSLVNSHLDNQNLYHRTWYTQGFLSDNRLRMLRKVFIKYFSINYNEFTYYLSNLCQQMKKEKKLGWRFVWTWTLWIFSLYVGRMIWLCC